MSNDDIRSRTTQNMVAKVELLEAIVNGEIPPLPGLPTSLTKFRSWSDPALGIVKIGSSSTTAKTHYELLVGRANKAIETLNSRRKARRLRVYKPLGEKAAELETEKRLLKEENRRLTSELAMYFHQLQTALRQKNAAETAKDLANRDVATLREELWLLTSAKPVRVK